MLCVCVCVIEALGIQHAVLVLRVILLSMASPAVQSFSTLYRKQNDFRGKMFIERKMCIVVFSTIVV